MPNLLLKLEAAIAIVVNEALTMTPIIIRVLIVF
jgi:hypothetical protein